MTSWPRANCTSSTSKYSATQDTDVLVLECEEIAEVAHLIPAKRTPNRRIDRRRRAAAARREGVARWW